MTGAETSMRERMLAGEDYLAADPELVAESRHAFALVRRFNDSAVEDKATRRAVLEQLLGRVGADVELRVPFRCDYGYQTFIGDRTFANFGLVILDVAQVRIGADVQIGPNVQLLTATHPLDAELRRAKWESGRPITIGDNAWLGGGVIVCPGVTIGPDAVIGAGAVVTHDVPTASLAVGNPARVIRSLGAVQAGDADNG